MGMNIVGVSMTPPPSGEPDSNKKSPSDPLLPTKEEFRRHNASKNNGWTRVFPTAQSATDHLHLFKRPGLLTTALIHKLRGNPRFGLGGDAAPPPGYFVFDNIVGAKLRRQSKDWKKGKNKKKTSSSKTYAVGKRKKRAQTSRTIDKEEAATLREILTESEPPCVMTP